MSKRMPVLCQEYMIGFCLPLNIQATLNTQQQRRAPGAAPPHPPSHAPLLLCVRPWLNIQWQSKKHILLAEDGHIFGMSSTSGYMGATYFQEFGPRFFDMSSASGYMGATYFQEFGPRFLGMTHKWIWI